MWEIYPALVMHLSQVKDAGQLVDARAKAGGFYTKLKTQQFVEFGHFLWDVVMSLSKLSLLLQKKNASVADVSNAMFSQVDVLKQMGNNQFGPKFTSVHGKNIFKDVDLIPERHRYAVPVDEPRCTICKDLVSSLQSRFKIDNDVVAATSLINKSS